MYSVLIWNCYNITYDKIDQFMHSLDIQERLVRSWKVGKIGYQEANQEVTGMCTAGNEEGSREEG